MFPISVLLFIQMESNLLNCSAEALKKKVGLSIQWIKDLNVRPETIKLLKEKIGRTLNHIKQDPL